MLMDAQNRPSLNQSLVGTGTIVSTDSIDMLSPSDNIGRSGMPMRMFAGITAALAGATSVQAQLIESANSNLSSPNVLASGPVVLLAAATLGGILLDVPMPDTAARYLGTQYIVVGTATGGTVTSGVVGSTDRGSRFIPMNLG